MSRAWAGGSTSKWRRTRAQVLQRDHHLCQIQLAGTCTTLADCVHHTIGRALTGDDPEWMVAACTPCNLKIGDPTTRPPDPQPRRMTQW